MRDETFEYTLLFTSGGVLNYSSGREFVGKKPETL